ncbi:MAG: type II secretion system protein GspJ [Parvularculaceae bacterium]
MTLAELLIALLIFAMISGAAVYSLRLSVEGRDQLKAADAATRGMQIARILIKEDVAQIALRLRRDEFGNLLPAPFFGGAGYTTQRPVKGEKPLRALSGAATITRAPTFPRSSLQAVEYLQIGDHLVRRTFPYVDGARDQPHTDRTLITGVISTSIDFLAGETPSGLTWVDAWPGPRAQGNAPPRAIRLTMTTNRFGEFEQLFWVGDIGS